MATNRQEEHLPDNSAEPVIQGYVDHLRDISWWASALEGYLSQSHPFQWPPTPFPSSSW